MSAAAIAAPVAAAFPQAGYHRVPRPMRPGPAPRRLEILFLYSRPPLPMTRGDELTVSHLLEFLHARGHVVDLVTLSEPGHSLRPEHQAWLESRCRSVELIPHSLKRSVPRAMRGWLSGWPLQIGLLLSPAQLARVRELVAGRRYDMAYAYYIRSAEALREARRRAAGPAHLHGAAALADTQHPAPGAHRRHALGPAVLPLRDPADGRLRGAAVARRQPDRADRRAGPGGDRRRPAASAACPKSTTSSGVRTGSTSSGFGPGPRPRRPTWS